MHVSNSEMLIKPHNVEAKDREKLFHQTDYNIHDKSPVQGMISITTTSTEHGVINILGQREGLT